MAVSSAPPTYRQIMAFLAVARAGSMSDAALSLDISQPAVSKHISALEQKVGLLFERRRGSRLHLTSAGRGLHARCDEILRNMRELSGNVEDARLTNAPIRIGAGEYLFFVVQQAIADFAKHNRDVQLELKLISSEDDGLRDLGNGVIDLFALTRSARPQGLASDLMRSVYLNVYASDDLVERVGLDELRACPPMVLPREASPQEGMVLALLSKLGIKNHTATHRVEYLRTAYAMCEQGLGAALLFDADASSDIACGKLVPLATKSIESYRCCFLGSGALERPLARDFAHVILAAG